MIPNPNCFYCDPSTTLRVAGVVKEIFKSMFKKFPQYAKGENDIISELYGYFYGLRISERKFIIGSPISLESADTVAPLDFCRCCYRSSEQAYRLWSAHMNKSHMSSWQSRDVSKNQLGGAIVAKDVIFSFGSELPETTNEAIMLITAAKLRLLSLPDAFEIAETSKNNAYLNCTALCTPYIDI